MNFSSTQKTDTQKQADQINESLSQEDEDYSQSNNFTLFSMPYISNETNETITETINETINESNMNNTSNQNMIFSHHQGYSSNDSHCYSNNNNNNNNRYSYIQQQPLPQSHSLPQSYSRSPSQSHHRPQGKTYNSPYVLSNNNNNSYNNSYNKNQILLTSLQSQSTEDSFLNKPNQTNQTNQNPYSNQINPNGNKSFPSSSSFLQSFGEAIKDKTIETIKTRLYSNEMSFIINSHLQKTIQKTNEIKDLLIETYENSENSRKDHIKSVVNSLFSHFSSMSIELSSLFDRHVKYNEYFKGIEEKISFYLEPLIEKEEKINEIRLKIKRKNEGNQKEDPFNHMLSIVSEIEQVISEIECVRSSKNKENNEKSGVSLSVIECGRINKVFNSRLESIMNEFSCLKNGSTFKNLTVNTDIAMYEVISTRNEKNEKKERRIISKIDGIFCFERFNKRCFVVPSKEIRKKKCFLDDSF